MTKNVTLLFSKEFHQNRPIFAMCGTRIIPEDISNHTVVLFPTSPENYRQTTLKYTKSLFCYIVAWHAEL